MKITMTDAIRAGHCPTGIRRWFTAHGLDFRSFMREGVDAEILRDRGDALSTRVIALKEKREAPDGQ